jgi:hypothetical protein
MRGGVVIPFRDFEKTPGGSESARRLFLHEVAYGLEIHLPESRYSQRRLFSDLRSVPCTDISLRT